MSPSLHKQLWPLSCTQANVSLESNPGEVTPKPRDNPVSRKMAPSKHGSCRTCVLCTQSLSHVTLQAQSNQNTTWAKKERSFRGMDGRSIQTCLDYRTRKRLFRNDLQDTHSEAAAIGIYKTINQCSMKTKEKSIKVKALWSTFAS